MTGWGDTPCLPAQAALTVVEGDSMQAVQQLPLVLMDSLDLNIEHGRRVDLDLVLLLQVGCKLQLVLLARKSDEEQAWVPRPLVRSEHSLLGCSWEHGAFSLLPPTPPPVHITCLTFATSLIKASLLMKSSNFFSWLRSVIKPSPIF